MLLTEIILRLRAECPLFARRVGGTAKFSKASESDQSKMSVPSCFVVPMGDSGHARAQDNQTSQMVTEHFATIVCVSNSIDRTNGRGKSASDTLKLARQELYDALVGWEPVILGEGKPVLNISEDSMYSAEEHEHLFADLIPNSRATTVQYVSGDHLSMNSSRLWHQYEWAISYTMDRSLDKRIEPGLRHGVENLVKFYSGFDPLIGQQHVDDYELMVDYTGGEQ